METAIQTVQAAVITPKPLKGSAKVVYHLLTSKYKARETLHLKEVVHAWADTIIPPQKKVVIGYWPEGKYRPQEHNRRQWVKDNWDNPTNAGQAVQWLKYHVGNLVLNGYMVAIPVVNLDAPVPPKQLSN